MMDFCKNIWSYNFINLSAMGFLEVRFLNRPTQNKNSFTVIKSMCIIMVSVDSQDLREHHSSVSNTVTVPYIWAKCDKPKEKIHFYPLVQIMHWATPWHHRRWEYHRGFTEDSARRTLLLAPWNKYFFLTNALVSVVLVALELLLLETLERKDPHKTSWTFSYKYPVLAAELCTGPTLLFCVVSPCSLQKTAKTGGFSTLINSSIHKHRYNCLIMTHTLC